MNYDSISPIDGRYREEARPLAKFFSERALASERLEVELAYLRLLVELGVAPDVPVPNVRLSMTEVKRIEGRVGHDVKAVELFLRESLIHERARRLAPFVHLGLTSEDTNSLAFARLLSSSIQEVLVPAYGGLALDISSIASKEAKTGMVARTHGQPAVPTTFGKEMAVFAVRIAERTGLLRSTRPMAKFSGAVGTYASFKLLGRRDWQSVLGRFVEGMGVDYARYSTQVVPGERLSDILHYVININQLMGSLALDLWIYQTLGYVTFERPGKVSSSTMPQKVNPVDLENAEGQAGISNSILSFAAYRLQTTRLQRDLSDSVIRRMVGQGLAHSLVSASRLRSSLRTMRVDRRRMRQDLTDHPEILAEAAQLRLRLEGDERGYEKVKKLTETGRFARTEDTKKAGSYLGDSVKLAAECRSEVERLLSKT